MQRKLFTILALAALTVLTFVGVSRLGFIGYDDPDYVTQNAIVQHGLSSEGLAWAFGNLHGQRTYWHPITWLTHMADCQFFGLNSGAHHIISLLWHTANVVLLFIFLAKATNSPWTSAAAAAIFAVHPLQVESVAWVTERKNLVSTFFALLSLIAYLRYTRSGKRRSYLGALLGFALALMSKPAVITLPCVMLLLDFWPLQRLKIAANQQSKWPQLRPLLIEKIPFFALSAASAFLTIFAHRDLGMMSAEAKPPAGLLFSNIVISYGQYLRKFLWPSDLAIVYPFPRSFSGLLVAGSLILLLALSFVAIRNWKRRPYLTVGWLWFVGVLVPMSGIVFVGIQAMADRFMYLPIIGLIVAICFLAAEVFNRMKVDRKVAIATTLIVLTACVAASRTQVGYWKDDFELFDHARKVTKDNYVAYNVVGGVFLRQGDMARAMTNLQTSIEIQPNFTDVHQSLGEAMLHTGNFAEAAKEFTESLRLGNRFPQDGYLKLAVAYEAMGNLNGALTNYATAVKLDPDMGNAQLGLGNMLLATGQFKEAIPHLRIAAARDPKSPEASGRLAWLLATHADPGVRNGAEAVQFAQKACELTGYSHSQSLNALAAAYAETGKFDSAVKTAEKALDIARGGGETNLAVMTESLLKLYQAGKPYREGTN